ncbi:hypothetical protein [Paenibacillus sp. NAIST15-1]|uniref:hypothetical protein n=1 Tax=Paenibacillus sp. NAIST15-1 TaxID=1605994 RepID=UPI000868E265|nr:hypothetical protein [Paenibacillus sp. NAIST15-1]GAV11294.1 hypothetical protein PBN151_1221 [Paenibacillus sp. NAIST15-1]
MGKYGIARLDLVKGHARHYDFDQPIENGTLGEEDYVTGKLVPTKDVTKRQKFVASVANTYDSRDESEFRNEVGGMEVRGYTLVEDDTITTTKIDFSGDRSNIGAVVKGDFAYAKVGGNFVVSSTFPTVDPIPAQVFRVEEKTTLNGQDALALKIEKA